MTLQLLKSSEVVTDGVTMALMQEADELAKLVNTFRPIAPEPLNLLVNRLLSERIYSSNAIEGNTLSLRETTQILETGMLYAEKRREAQEVLNLRDGIQRVGELVQDPESAWNREQFLLVHRYVLRQIDDEAAGCIRRHDVMIRGAKHQPPDPTLVDDLLAQLFDDVKASMGLAPLLRATWVHWAITRVHPFLDGNGRMARLWQDLVLFQSGLTASVIRPSDRTEYYQALQTADDGELNPLMQLVSRRCLRTLQEYVNVQKETDSLSNWAKSLVSEATQRLQEQRKLEYLRWLNAMELLRDAMKRCAAQVTAAAGGEIDLQVRDFDGVDEDTWDSLRSGAGGTRTWFFTLTGRRYQRWCRYTFFFLKHFWNSEELLEIQRMPLVSLRISEQLVPNESAIRLDVAESKYVSLREVIPTDGTYYRVIFDQAADSLNRDFCADPLVIAQDFIGELVSRRLLS